jgi:hypothetical protein
MAEVLDVAGALRSTRTVSSLDSAALHYDPINLAVSYGVPIPPSLDADAVQQRSTQLAQALIHQLFSLPVEKSDVGPLALISASGLSGASAAAFKATTVPREKPVRLSTFSCTSYSIILTHVPHVFPPPPRRCREPRPRRAGKSLPVKITFKRPNGPEMYTTSLLENICHAGAAAASDKSQRIHSGSSKRKSDPQATFLLLERMKRMKIPSRSLALKRRRQPRINGKESAATSLLVPKMMQNQLSPLPHSLLPAPAFALLPPSRKRVS